MTIQAIDEDEMMNNKILQLRINGIPTPPESNYPIFPLKVSMILCSIVLDGTDPDGDPLSYNYMGSEWSNHHTHNRYHFRFRDTFGETWTCMAQSNDGYAQSNLLQNTPQFFLIVLLCPWTEQVMDCSFQSK